MKSVTSDLKGKIASVKPMIKYRGGKSKELSKIIPWVPQFQGRYVEPFFGGGALYFRLEPTNAIINDLNSPLMTFYDNVADDFPRLKRELQSIEDAYSTNRMEFEALKAAHPTERVPDSNEQLYYDLRDQYNGLVDSPYLPGTLYYFINKTAYSGMIRFNKSGHYNVPYGRYKHFNTSKVSKAHSDLLKSAIRMNTDFDEVFQMLHSDDFVFLDPPYDSKFSDYGNEETKDGFSQEDHRRLAYSFFTSPAQGLIVIGSTPLTEELYGSHVVARYNKNYAVNIRNRFQASSEHILATNR